MPAISPATAISAIRLASESVSRVGKTLGDALGFDDVLNSGGEASSVSSLSDLRVEFASSAKRSLSMLGLSVNQGAVFSVQSNGQIHVEGDHPHAARIEAAVNGDPELSELAKQIARQSGGDSVSIELTHSPDLTDLGPEMNIHAQRAAKAGGYANWLAD